MDAINKLREIRQKCDMREPKDFGGNIGDACGASFDRCYEVGFENGYRELAMEIRKLIDEKGGAV